MRQSVIKLGQKWLQGMVEYLLVFPVLLIAAVYLAPDFLIGVWLAVLPLIFLAVLVFHTFFPGRKRVFYLVFVFILAALAAWLFQTDTLLALVTFAVSMPAGIRGILYAEQPWHDLFSGVYLWTAGFLLYFSSYFFFRYNESFQPYLGLLTGVALLMLVVTLFINNNENLKSATLSKEENPWIGRGVKRHNQFFILATVVLILLIANFRAIQAAFTDLVLGIVRAIFGLLNLFTTEGPPAAPGEAPGPPAMGGMEPSDPSLIAVILEKVFFVLGSLLVLAFIFLFLWLLVKKFRHLFYKVYQKLAGFFDRMLQPGQSRQWRDAYTDEKESTFDWQDWRRQQQEKAKEKLTGWFRRPPRFAELTSREKVRYLYRHFLARQVENGYNVKTHYTVRETLKELEERLPDDRKVLDKLDVAYAAARYGRRENEEAEIEELARLLREKDK